MNREKLHIANSIVEGNTWSDLSDEDRKVFLEINELLGFSEDQRNEINLWWFRITSEEVNQINDLVPEGTMIESKVNQDGFSYINSDVISDALENRRLSSLYDLLSEKIFYLKEIESWQA